MAEFAIATGIVQVAGAGVALTKALCNFGATTSSAGEQTDFIGKNITLYCRVLKTLGQQLKVKEPDHTTEALEVAREIHEQSNSLFQKIWKLLPTTERDNCGLSLKQKILWGFRRTRVDYLVGQLEYLKSTVSLLLHVLSSVPKLRKYRRSQKKSKREKDEISSRLQEQQNLLYERCQAQRQLQGLAERANRDSMPLLTSTGSVDLSLMHKEDSNYDMANSSGGTLAQIDAYTSGLSAGNERALILQRTTSWLAQLYAHWTTLSDDRDGGDRAFDVVDVAELTASPVQSGVSQATNTKQRNGEATQNMKILSNKPMDWVPSADQGISLEYQPHIREGSGGCECVRARMQPSPEYDEFFGISLRIRDLLIHCQANKNLSQHAKNLLHLSARRKELDQRFQDRCCLPLIRACREKLSEFLAQIDIRIADLCNQRVEAMAKDAWERCDAIKQEELPRLMEKRKFLASCLSMNLEFYVVLQDDGSITASPLQCSHDFQDFLTIRERQAETHCPPYHGKNNGMPASALNELGPDKTFLSARPTVILEPNGRSSHWRDFDPENYHEGKTTGNTFERPPDVKSSVKTKAPVARATNNHRQVAHVESDTDSDVGVVHTRRKSKSTARPLLEGDFFDSFFDMYSSRDYTTTRSEWNPKKESPKGEPHPTTKIEDPIADGVEPDPFGQSKFWTSGGTLLNDGQKFTTIDEAAKGRHER